jgi:signal transduction histidine kinase
MGQIVEEKDRKEKSAAIVSADTPASGERLPAPKAEVKIAKEVPTRQRRPNIKRLVGSHHIGLAIVLSIASVLAGLLLIFFALGLFLPTVENYINRFVSGTAQQHIIFGVAGLALLVAPLLLDRFVFNALRYEREMRARAEKSAREAQLLQDILAHDIRNYNQVAKLSADLITEEFSDNKSAMELVSTLQDSIKGSTELVDRAKMLGNIISDLDRTGLRQVSALDAMKRSMAVVAAANPEKKVECVVKLGDHPPLPLSAVDEERSGNRVNILADALADQIFVNLFSNSVKYTEGERVFVSIEIRREKNRRWKISITDLGKGIPSDLKKSLFSRYLEGARGSGLGMSIVHALVVGRYGGRIEVKDRLEGDYTKGTLVELTLPAA